MSTNTEERTGRLFRTLVLMGSSLALGCGGVAEKDGDGASGGGSASGGSTNTGGSTGGGAAQGSGGLSSGTGGSIATGGQPPIEPGPFDCDPAQLACDTAASICSSNEHIAERGGALPASCNCDPERPVSAEDCVEGETFLCDRAVVDHRDAPFDRVVDFNCRCVADETECGAVCDHMPCMVSHYGPVGDAPAPALCDCALPILR